MSRKASVPYSWSRPLLGNKGIVMVMFIFKWKSESFAESHWEQSLRTAEPADMISLALMISSRFLLLFMPHLASNVVRGTRFYYNSQSNLVYMLGLFKLFKHIYIDHNYSQIFFCLFPHIHVHHFEIVATLKLWRFHGMMSQGIICVLKLRFWG